MTGKLRWSEHDAAREFAAVRERLFPEWRDGEQWTIVPAHHPEHGDSPGVCAPLEQRLYIPLADSLQRWRVVLVHEICHAISGSDHGPEFRTCLHDVVARARLLGENDLAEAVLRELAAGQSR